jgi:galactoside O-acetyltransferase
LPPSDPVVIEDNVWIGSKVVILPGVRIGSRAVIGAGSVVTKDIPPRCVAAGNPARVLRHLTELD